MVTSSKIENRHSLLLQLRVGKTEFLDFVDAVEYDKLGGEMALPEVTFGSFCIVLTFFNSI